MKVKVVISGGKIASVEVVENHDDSSYLNRAKALIGNIISSQSTNVDVISGATYSSNGIKSAVRDALRQAAVSGNSQSVNTKTEDTSKTEDNTTVKGNFPYKEGIYYGTAEGYNGEIEVAVVLQDKSIKAVLVTKNHDDEKFFNRAMDVVKKYYEKTEYGCGRSIRSNLQFKWSYKCSEECIKRSRKGNKRTDNGTR